MPTQLAFAGRSIRDFERITPFLYLFSLIRQICENLTVNNERHLFAIGRKPKFVDISIIGMVDNWVYFFVCLNGDFHWFGFSGVKVKPPDFKIAFKNHPFPIRRDWRTKHAPIGEVGNLLNIFIACQRHIPDILFTVTITKIVEPLSVRLPHRFEISPQILGQSAVIACSDCLTHYPDVWVPRLIWTMPPPLMSVVIKCQCFPIWWNRHIIMRL